MFRTILMIHRLAKMLFHINFQKIKDLKKNKLFKSFSNK